jgi:hypothetical protein
MIRGLRARFDFYSIFNIFPGVKGQRRGFIEAFGNLSYLSTCGHGVG